MVGRGSSFWRGQSAFRVAASDVLALRQSSLLMPLASFADSFKGGNVQDIVHIALRQYLAVTALAAPRRPARAERSRPARLGGARPRRRTLYSGLAGLLFFANGRAIAAQGKTRLAKIDCVAGAGLAIRASPGLFTSGRRANLHNRLARIVCAVPRAVRISQTKTRLRRWRRDVLSGTGERS